MQPPISDTGPAEGISSIAGDSPATRATGGARFATAQLAKFWICVRSESWPQLKKRLPLLWGNLSKLVFGVISLVTVIVIAVWLYESLTHRTLVIAPISVPKALAENGYTPEVAGARLRDALTKYVATATYTSDESEIGLQSELPDIIVPTVGISLDTIAASIRTFMRLDRRRNISGEFIVRDAKLWLRLRLNGREFYTSDHGIDPENPDRLFTMAAPMLFEEIHPHLVAGTNDPAQRLERANRIISEREESDENVGPAYVVMGSVYHEQKNYARATETLTRAVRLKPDYAPAYYAIGRLLDAQGKPDEAIAQYRKAIEVDPKYAAAYNGLGVVLYGRRKYEEAIAAYRQAIRINPRHAVARNNLGIVLHLNGRHDEAIAQHRKAIEINPKYVRAYYSLGTTLRDDGQRDAAIAQYRKTIEIDPKHDGAHYNIGLALHADGQHQEAIAAYRNAIELNPKFAAAHYRLGNALREEGQRDEAIAQYRKAIEINPNYSIARESLEAALASETGVASTAP